jgi:hypothetical protein
MKKINQLILMHDLVIVGLFSFLAWRIVEMSMNATRDCFLARQGVFIGFFMGLIFIVALCFLNHSNKIEMATEKWYKFLLHIMIALIIFAIINVIIFTLGENFQIGGPYDL